MIHMDIALRHIRVARLPITSNFKKHDKNPPRTASAGDTYVDYLLLRMNSELSEVSTQRPMPMQTLSKGCLDRRTRIPVESSSS